MNLSSFSCLALRPKLDWRFRMTDARNFEPSLARTIEVTYELEWYVHVCLAAPVAYKETFSSLDTAMSRAQKILETYYLDCPVTLTRIETIRSVFCKWPTK